MTLTKKRKIVLIVEDDAQAGQIAAALLTNTCGYVVEIRGTATAALERIRENNLDLIILDLGLPDMHGLALAMKLREEDYLTPIILFSGDIDPQTEGKAAELEYVWTQQKPATRDLVAKCRLAISETWTQNQVGNIRKSQDALKDDVGALQEGQNEVLRVLDQLSTNMVTATQVEDMSRDITTDMIEACRNSRTQSPEVQQRTLYAALTEVLPKALEESTAIDNEVQQSMSLNLLGMLLNNRLIQLFLLTALGAFFAYYNLQARVSFNERLGSEIDNKVKEIRVEQTKIRSGLEDIKGLLKSVSPTAPISSIP